MMYRMLHYRRRNNVKAQSVSIVSRPDDCMLLAIVTVRAIAHVPVPF